MIRQSAAAAVAVAALLLAGCSAGGQPLASANNQEGVLVCAEAPNQYASVGVTAWNSPMGYSITWYYNASAAPLEIASVSLIDPHGLVLHGAIVYEMRHSEHPLINVAGWPLMGQGADPGAWAHRQRVPGAVIPAETGTPAPNARDLYVVVPDISAATPAGGWAIGLQVTYRQGGTQYTFLSYEGYAIGPPGPDGPRCQAQQDAIHAAWPNR
jgi:hypothetical protein